LKARPASPLLKWIRRQQFLTAVEKVENRISLIFCKISKSVKVN
jgi:hypothetical protein